MAYERIILDIETTNLLEPMIDFTKRPLALKPDAKLWCIAVKCIDTNNSFVMIPPEILEEIEQGKYQDTPEIEEEYSKITIVPLTKDRLDKMFSNIVKTFIGHNIIKFDLPALKLFGLLDYDIGYPYYEELNNSFKTETTINGKEIDICDTLVLSKLLNADRFGGHSLKNFGKNNGLEKMEFEKFDSFSKHMVVYCLRDVNVNHDAYNALIDEKGDYEGWDKPYTMEAKLADLVLKQELFGFEYDLELSAKNKVELDKLLEDRYNTVTPNIPPKPLNIGEAKQWTPPKVKFSKSSNSISSHMKKFLEKIGAEYNPFTNKYTFEGKEYDLYYDGPVKETLPASIKDLAHLKGYLISLGWIPSQWNIRDLTRDSKKKIISKDKFLATVDRYVEDTFEGPFKELRLKELELSLKKTTPEKLKEFLIGQYNDKRIKPIRVPTTPPFRVGATKDLCPNLEALAQNGTIPFVKDMVEYFTYTHRRNSISGGVDEETGEPSKGFESYIREDGRIGTPVDSNATNTSRMAHKVVCNIPRVSSLYGGNMRALFAVGNNQLQYGYDYSSLENRIQGHYIYNYEGGPELAETLLADKPNDVHTINSKKLGISRDNAKALTYALLYGAAAPKLQKMLDLDKEGAEKMYEDFWNSVLPLKMFRDDATKFWESTGKEYILGIDGRKFHVRSAHSIVNLLFQSAGSLSMKYGVILSSQMLEEQNYLGNLLDDSKEESENKVNEMILYHDECQYAIPKSWYHPVYFDDKEEAENYKIQNNMCTPVHYSEKLSKFYLDGQNQLTDIILEAIQNVIRILRLKVDLGIEWSVGLNWRDTH